MNFFILQSFINTLPMEIILENGNYWKINNYLEQMFAFKLPLRLVRKVRFLLFSLRVRSF